MNYLESGGAWVVGGIGSLYAFATGNFETTTLVLFAIMGIDIASGILKGLKKKNLKSAIMSIGLMKKGGIILAILLAGLLDEVVNGGQPVFITMMTWLTIGNETLSVVENISALGVQFPNAMIKRLGQVVDHYDDAQVEKDMSPKELEENKDDLLEE